MASWVFHIGAFIVPRQMVELGDPARRSADACESFGAMLKKLIKHATCRRRRTVDASGAKSLTGGEGSQQLWKTAFTVGYIQQAFRRACVRESLQHGPENAPFLQRADARRTAIGRATVSRKCVGDSPVPPFPSVYEASSALRANGDEPPAP